MAIKFTNMQLNALKPEAKRYVVFGEGDKGLGVRVEPSGTKTFFFEYKFNGKNRLYTIGRYPQPVGLAQARTQAAKLKEKVRNGIDPGSEQKAKNQAHRDAETIKVLADEYLERHAKVKKSSWKEDERILMKDVLPVWGKRKAKDIVKRDINLLLDGIVDRGAKVAANRTLSVITKMFNFAVARDILAASPCVKIPRPAKEVPRDRKLSEDEIKILWAGLEPDSGISIAPIMKLALRFMAVTAQRKSEVLNAVWTEFNFHEDYWELPAHRTKNGKAHRVPLSPLALEILEAAKQVSKGSEWVFPSPVGKRTQKKTPGVSPIVGSSLDHAVRRTLTNFGIEHFTPHDLRRTATSMITGLGVPRLTVKKILNHTDSEVTGIYDRHDYFGEKKQALLAWDKKLRTIVTGELAKILPIQKFS
ncbi:MAG: tyrosine-type recombinase/integrase [Nitrospinae bacterium]|nr:tyrosine-type recombinase/integrase [Nitrospinota bacterium]